MEIDYLIVGQGIAGTLLSHELLATGKSVMVMDKPEDTAIASLVAGAVINPASGKKWVASAEQRRFIPQALATYGALEKLLGAVLLKETSLYIFHESEEKRMEAREKLQTVNEEQTLQNDFNYEYGVSRSSPLYLVAATVLLAKWRKYLITQNSFRTENFEHGALLQNDDGIIYKDINAKKVIFCEGAAGGNNPLFNHLPFTKNRGEALLLSIPDLDEQTIYHQQNIRLVPKGNGLFWCGSNYQWGFEDLKPDETWRQETEMQLTLWLKKRFTVVGHIVAERPTTAGQFPLLGTHPAFPATAIFNGLGTRGFSSGPFWARELVQLLENSSYEMRYYDVGRFKRFFS